MAIAVRSREIRMVAIGGLHRDGGITPKVATSSKRNTDGNIFFTFFMAGTSQRNSKPCCRDGSGFAARFFSIGYLSGCPSCYRGNIL
jgi:hypothetical protein